jgi:hypothetical protein
VKIHEGTPDMEVEIPLADVSSWAAGSAYEATTIQRSGSGAVLLAGISVLLAAPIAGAFRWLFEREGVGARFR